MQPVSSDGICLYNYQCNDRSDVITQDISSLVRKLNTGGYNEACPCNPPFICCKTPPITDNRNVPIPKPFSIHCGEQVNIVGPRILSSDNENLTVDRASEYPWTLALFKITRQSDGSENYAFICGASLIGQRVAVTVNHNVLDPGSYVIRAGSLSLQINEDEFLEPQDRPISKVIIFKLPN